ncbi:protein GDAP2 homolog [Nasonia vitripennis]|uniref:Protein GDAP2 homolog n=1 Tax=Nasonia vitripennis TaxID=7425 RepID=A0A7M7TCP5_NASVI|nr:protein GDAP2 homolog [Nasonia vitripennis]XP_031783737.1 protein GDAP2 homolog [Nasonia vitripennis]XP_031783738.1 protein GDAP2 homolog [Nasonia vitripennis]XP_031783739.1 protein GDAP2 homolog [Nasonia vitripennis]XP_031783740.1 protein GDAP2 homolog [Nasonia vitripennis]XP_032453857.1 protein GDAP2 homolog [Nasonia vitripennis]XP_032453858.1 protein GDAP2 homolog [Nasonia vitripennis]
MRLMEPLAFDHEAVELSALKRWADFPTQHRFADYSNSLTDSAAHYTVSPFPCQPTLNNKIAIWTGDMTVLQLDAIVNSTSETMDDNSPMCQRIFARAGPGLKKEIYNEVKECRTGEVKTTQGHGLPARFIIHTVGPVYNTKYQTAAENTLHCCYRNVLQKARELGLRSIALPVINSVRRNYPPDAGAHIALRTVRRFLEQYSESFNCVIFVLEPCDLGIYEVLLSLYFPRTLAEEENACWQLPSDIGGMDGEPQLPDRQIRIIDNPQHALHGDETVDLSAHLETSVSLGEHAFTQMQGDLDRQRLLGERPTADPLADIMLKQMQHKERYERLLRRAKMEDLTEVSGIGCLYQSGVDRQGRPVVVFLGKWFPANNLNLDKALLYLIQLLDPIVKGDYVIAYFHTLTVSSNYPSLHWLKEVYNVLPYKYKKNLKQFYIVHPTFWTKMMTWWFTTFMAPAIKQKVHNLPGVEYLYEVMSPDQLEIPAYITEYDMTINGLRYYQPEQYSQAST